MRKSLIFSALFLLVLVSGYSLVAYYMGDKLKNDLQAMIQNYNQQGSNLRIKLKEYNQGIFQSSTKLIAQYDNFSPFHLSLKFLHKPIIYHQDPISRSNIHFLKLLVATSVSQEFLGEHKELLRNLSLVDPLGKVKINLRLSRMAQLFYNLIGFDSNIHKYSDATAELNFDNDRLSLLILGQGMDLRSFDGLYDLETSEFKIIMNFLVNAQKQANWLNSYNIELLGSNLKSNTSEAARLFLADPKVTLNLTGDLFYFLDAIKYNKGLFAFIDENKPIKLHGKFTNTDFNMVNSFNDDITANNLELEFLLDNKLNNNKKIVSNKFSLNDLKLKTITDKANISNIKFDFNLDLNKETKEAVDIISGNLFSLEFISNFLENQKAINSLDMSFMLNKVVSNGLLSGKFDLDNLMLNISLQKNNKDGDTVLINKTRIDNWLWELRDKTFELGLDNANMKFDGNINLSEYFNDLLNDKKELYQANYNYDFTLPTVRLFTRGFDFEINQASANGKFALNRKETGYLNNNVKVDNFKFRVSDTNTVAKNIDINTDMKQSYKYMLTGTSKIKADQVGTKIFDADFKADKLQYSNKSIFNQNQIQKLEYENDFLLDHVELSGKNYGNIKINNKFYDINVKDYQSLISWLNYIFLDQNYNHELTKQQQDEKIIEVIIDFLTKGLSSDNKIKFGNSEGLKVYNILRLDNLNKKDIDKDLNQIHVNSIDKQVDNLISQAKLAFNIVVSKKYLENIIKNIGVQEIDKLYDNLQKIGLLEYKQPKDIKSKKNNTLEAEVKVIYSKGKIIINDKNLDYWQNKIKKKASNKKYFEQLKSLELKSLE